MVVVESSMAGGRKEVALAAIALLSAVLAAHGSITDIVTPAMWKRSVRALGVGVEAATSPACMVPLMVSYADGGFSICCHSWWHVWLLRWPQQLPAGMPPAALTSAPPCCLFKCTRPARSCWRSLASCTPACARASTPRTPPPCLCGLRCGWDHVGGGIQSARHLQHSSQLHSPNSCALPHCCCTQKFSRNPWSDDDAANSAQVSVACVRAWCLEGLRMSFDGQP